MLTLAEAQHLAQALSRGPETGTILCGCFCCMQDLSQVLGSVFPHLSWGVEMQDDTLALGTIMVWEKS